MADLVFPVSTVRTGAVIVAMLALLTARAQADAQPLRLQAISQETPDGCVGVPELDARVEAEVKQLTGRTTHRVATAPVNPTLTPAEATQLFGGYIEPLDNDWWRARLWLKDAGRSQVAVRDTYYRNLERLNAELPQDAAALVLMPDWSRTASAAPQYCLAQLKPPPYPDDACDAFLPPLGCGVPFDCTQSNQAPRCSSTGPTCGIAGKPSCTPAPPPCRARDWQFRTGIAALVVGGTAVILGGVFQSAASNVNTQASSPLQTEVNWMPAAITSYVAGGALLGAGAGMMAYWGHYASSPPCKKAK